jgi:TATA-binding protein-associated factor Taf7
MARGWESKAVTDQIEEGKESPAQRTPDFDRSPEARMRREQLESIKLSRARTLAQLERATNPAYRNVLEKALRSLEEETERITRLLNSGASD